MNSASLDDTDMSNISYAEEDKRMTRVISPGKSHVFSDLDGTLMETSDQELDESHGSSTLIEDPRMQMNAQCSEADIVKQLDDIQIEDSDISSNEDDSTLITEKVLGNKPIAEVQPFGKPLKKATEIVEKKPVKSNPVKKNTKSSKNVDKMEMVLYETELQPQEQIKRGRKQVNKNPINETKLDKVENLQTGRAKRVAKVTELPPKEDNDEAVSEVPIIRKGKNKNTEDVVCEPKTKTNSRKLKQITLKADSENLAEGDKYAKKAIPKKDNIEEDNKSNDIPDPPENPKKRDRKPRNGEKTEAKQNATSVLKENDDLAVENSTVTTKRTRKRGINLPANTTETHVELTNPQTTSKTRQKTNKGKEMQEVQPQEKEPKRQVKKAPLKESNVLTDVDNKPKKEGKNVKSKAVNPAEEGAIEQVKVTKERLTKDKNKKGKSDKESNENEAPAILEDAAEPVKQTKNKSTKEKTKNAKSTKETKETQSIVKQETLTTKRTTRKK